MHQLLTGIGAATQCSVYGGFLSISWASDQTWDIYISSPTLLLSYICTPTSLKSIEIIVHISDFSFCETIFFFQVKNLKKNESKLDGIWRHPTSIISHVLTGKSSQAKITKISVFKIRPVASTVNYVSIMNYTARAVIYNRSFIPLLQNGT